MSAFKYFGLERDVKYALKLLVPKLANKAFKFPLENHFLQILQ
jgi:hypothetical protein